MTGIYLAISLSTHSGDDTPQNYELQVYLFNTTNYEFPPEMFFIPFSSYIPFAA